MMGNEGERHINSSASDWKSQIVIYQLATDAQRFIQFLNEAAVPLFIARRPGSTKCQFSDLIQVHFN